MSVAAFAFAMALAQGAAAPPAPAPPTEVTGVIVEATPHTAEVARGYIDRFADPPARAISLATWRTPICLSVENLDPHVTMLLSAQIAARAAAVGVKTRTEGCAPNVMIVATSDGRMTAASLVEDHPRAFFLNADTQGDKSALRQFTERDAPVRWWTIGAQYDTQMRGFMEQKWGSNVSGRAFSWQPSVDPLTTFNANLVRAMVRTIVVVDASETAHVPVDALGDYIAMVVLAETDPEGPVENYPTILNLWRRPAEIPAMTAWDELYLRSLYCAEVRQPGLGAASIKSQAQKSDIARRMVETQRPLRSDGRLACKNAAISRTAAK